MRFLLMLLALTGATATAQDLKRNPPYGEDVAGIYGEIQQVMVWEEVCSDEFPATTDSNRRAVENWRSQYMSFVQEMEQRYRSMLWQESRQDPIRHKALLDHFERARDTAKKEFRKALVRGGMGTFRKQCENYPLYLKSPTMNLEVSQADVVNRVRRVARTFN